MIASVRVGTERHGTWQRKALRVSVLLFVTLLVAGLGAAPAAAGGSSGHSHEGSSALAVGGLLLAAAVLALAAAARSRRARVLALALLVGGFGLEVAVHSVHHFSDPQGAASCMFFAASQHVQGADASPTIAEPTWTTQFSTVFDGHEIRPLQDLSSPEGRGPPFRPSA